MRRNRLRFAACSRTPRGIIAHKLQDASQLILLRLVKL